MLLDYTSYAEIRAVLGVEEKELEDVTLALPMYSYLLETELDGLNPVISGIYAGYKARLEATPVTNPLSFTERKIYGTIQVYAAYTLADILTGSLPSFAPKVITDGKASQERMSDAYAKMQTDIKSMRLSLASRLITLLTDEGLIPNTIATVYTPFVGVPLGVDPVTGS